MRNHTVLWLGVFDCGLKGVIGVTLSTKSSCWDVCLLWRHLLKKKINKTKVYHVLAGPIWMFADVFSGTNLQKHLHHGYLLVSILFGNGNER